MGLKEWLIPQDKIFFDMLEKQSFTVLEGANKLMELLQHPDGIERKVRELKDIEHQGDKIIKEICEQLDKTFITPIDKEDISLLTSRFDDILDLIYGSANRLMLYQIPPTKAMQDMADIIIRSAKELNTAMIHIRNLNNGELIEKTRVEVNRLENAADEILNKSLVEIFKETDPISIIKNKEIIEYLELATDKCEDVANVMEIF